MKIRPNEPVIDKKRHLSLDILQHRLSEAENERTRTLKKIVQRQSDGSRKEPTRGYLSVEKGLVGDRWSLGKEIKKEEQLAIMDYRVAHIIANGQSLTLFGDNLFLDMDFSALYWSVGTRFQLGEAVLEVSPEPHDGCSKFAKRFGSDALKLTCLDMPKRLRGIYAMVIEAGWVEIGERARVLQ